MEIQQHGGKVHVAIGADLHDGIATLGWTLTNWSSDSVTIVILYADICKHFVYTPVGKIPASSLSEEKLRVLEKCEDVKTEKIISKYVAFCKKVKTEVVKVRRNDDSLPKVLVDMITNHGITKLVMAFSFIKSSSWKSKNAVRASFYVQRQKPDFCDFFVVCNGKPVFLREINNEGFVEDEQGTVIAKVREKRMSFRGWLGKKLYENGSGKTMADSSSSAIKDHGDKRYEGPVHYFNQIFSSSEEENSSLSSTGEKDRWETYKEEEIEEYFDQLLSCTAEEGDIDGNGTFDVPKLLTLEDMQNSGATRENGDLKIRIREMEEVIQLNQKEAMVNAERCSKAKWAISLCTKQAGQLEDCINQETAKRMVLKKDLDTTKELLLELQTEVEQKRHKLNSVHEIQRELSNKLQLSSAAKSHSEIRLDKSIRTRSELLQEIENLRSQKDVLRRRIEFCKEKDAIRMGNKSRGFSFDLRKFTASEIRVATDDFSKSLRLKSAGQCTKVYRGHMHQTTVAIKLFESDDALSPEAFNTKVKLLNSIRHPHILGILGSCLEPQCIVYEFMDTGSLRDLSSDQRRRTKAGNKSLSWHARIRIAFEVCTALNFLHKAKPWPIIHGNLNPSKILLDQNNIAKIYGLNPCPSKDEFDIRSDIRAFGKLLLQLLRGRNWSGLEEAINTKVAEGWPSNLAEEIGEIAKCCLSTDQNMDREFNSNLLMRRMNNVRRKADELVARGDSTKADEGDINMRDSCTAPSMFLCPIYQDVMKDPYVAADGFSYEHEAIKEWLQTGHDTSPMTNLKLQNKSLTPNHILHSMIQEWKNKDHFSI